MYLRGFVGMGARRWIDLGLIQLQPSSLMNIALVLALARYFHARSDEEIARQRYLIPPALMVVIPAALVLKQPDLGTAVMLLITGVALFFIAGVRLLFFALMVLATAGFFACALMSYTFHADSWNRVVSSASESGMTLSYAWIANSRSAKICEKTVLVVSQEVGDRRGNTFTVQYCRSIAAPRWEPIVIYSPSAWVITDAGVLC